MTTGKPILFSAPMVRAILEGRKTQTRRIVKKYIGEGTRDNPLRMDLIKCPYGQTGGALWVRETFRSNKKYFIGYKADGSCGVFFQNGAGSRYFLKHGQMTGGGCPPKDGTQYGIRKYGDCWKPSIHMPRWASRITLEIKDIRVERLQGISEEDAKAEGCVSTAIENKAGDDYSGAYASENFAELWQSINGPDSWDANPWVWVVEFKVHQCNIDDYLKKEAA